MDAWVVAILAMTHASRPRKPLKWDTTVSMGKEMNRNRFESARDKQGLCCDGAASGLEKQSLCDYRADFWYGLGLDAQTDYLGIYRGSSRSVTIQTTVESLHQEFPFH